MFNNRFVLDKDNNIILGQAHHVCVNCKRKINLEHPRENNRSKIAEITGKNKGQKVYKVMTDNARVDIIICKDCINEIKGALDE